MTPVSPKLVVEVWAERLEPTLGSDLGLELDRRLRSRRVGPGGRTVHADAGSVSSIDEFSSLGHRPKEGVNAIRSQSNPIVHGSDYP